ncbi:MAG: ABC transporter permease [Nitriliruptorales bacterium]
MTRSIAAELLTLRKRASTWILMGIWTALAVFFGFVLPYLTGAPTQELLPQNLHTAVILGFPFFGGVFAIMLGVLAIGSEYGWDTLKTLFTQRPSRLQVFAAKLAALAVVLAAFVVAVFAAGAVAGSVIGQVEGAAVAAPPAGLLLRALGAGWLILAAWAAFGVLLAVLSRGTALAIGVGIVYTLVVEGLVSALASVVSWLEPLVEFLVRANAYSLITPLGLSPQDVAIEGPGAYFGPFVAGQQALVVLAAYIAGFVMLSALLLRRRDVA